MVEPPSPLLSSGKARLYWLFCRLSVVELRRLLIAPLYPLAGTVRAFTACAATTPSADFCHGVRNDLSLLSLEFETGDRSPELSSTAFNAQPLDLHSVPLMDVGFAAIGQLARTLPASYPVFVHRLTSLLRVSFRPRLARSEERRVGKECRYTRWPRDWSSDVCSSDLEFETGDRSPELSSTAFNAQPLDLHSVPMMDVGFAAIGQLARTLPASYPVFVHRLASLLRVSFRPRLA